METGPAAERFAIALFQRIDRPAVEGRTVSLDELVKLLTTFELHTNKENARLWSPTLYKEGFRRGNAGVLEVSALVFDLDHTSPDPKRLEHVCWIGHTTWSNQPEAPKWRLIVPLASSVSAVSWAGTWRSARAALAPEADPSCKDASRAYFLPSYPPGATREAAYHRGRLLEPLSLPQENPEQSPSRAATAFRTLRAATSDEQQRRGQAYLAKVVANLEAIESGGRNTALNRAAWYLGRWVAAGALSQAEVEDALYRAAINSRLVTDDGTRQCWRTIRSGLDAGLRQPIDLNTLIRK
jgi:hypothetical protein